MGRRDQVSLHKIIRTLECAFGNPVCNITLLNELCHLKIQTGGEEMELLFSLHLSVSEKH